MAETPFDTNPIVLVVDDDFAMRLLMRESLESDGLLVHEAENGQEAITLFSDLRPALVLLDVQMPVMNGFQACEEIKLLPGGQDASIIMVTALDDVVSIERAYNAGATDFITKPINWPILGHRVRYVLRARDAILSLQRSEARLRQAHRVACLGNWDWNVIDNSLFWSDEIFRIFGVSREDFGGNLEAFLSVIHPADQLSVQDSLDESLALNVPFSVDHRVVLPDGSARIVHEQAEVVSDELGKAVRMHGTVQDITERKKSEEKIRKLAYFDMLTGLPNRLLFQDYTSQVLQRAKKKRATVALLYLDIDRFNRINDSLGHNFGDKVLQKIARRLTKRVGCSCLGDDEIKEDCTCTLSRLGGDEFTFLIADLENITQADQLANRVLEHIARPIIIQEQEFFITGSIGIALFPEDGSDTETILKNAETAMYHAKHDGRNCVMRYGASMSSLGLERLNMESRLKKALEQEELVLHYQPQVDIKTGSIIGVEALVRWNLPEVGLIPPGEFIPLAEESGLIIPIGEWVMFQACQHAKKWQDAGVPEVRISVNLSSHQFRQYNLIDVVQKALKKAGIEPHYLDLELTESAIMTNVEEAIRTLDKLKEIGVHLSVDDFGTGYSSMSYLKRFPLDTLKIDKSFVRDVTSDVNDAAIAEAIINLGKSLDLQIIAEGVETQDQLLFLKEKGCHLVQGYLFSRPIPEDEVEELLKTDMSKLLPYH